MAQRRGSSVPVSGMANPFWSQRIRAEWDLQAVRPADLPVPEDEETQKQLEQEAEGQPLEDVGARGRSRAPTRGSSPRRLATFTTPQSWESGKGVGSSGELRTAGLMPTSEDDAEKAMKGRSSTLSQGPEPGGEQEGDSLQRALEREMMNQLHEENMKLKQMLSRLQQSKGDWNHFGIRMVRSVRWQRRTTKRTSWFARSEKGAHHVHSKWNKGAFTATSYGSRWSCRNAGVTTMACRSMEGL